MKYQLIELRSTCGPRNFCGINAETSIVGSPAQLLDNDSIRDSAGLENACFNGVVFRTTGAKSAYGHTDCLWNLIGVEKVSDDLTVLIVAEDWGQLAGIQWTPPASLQLYQVTTQGDHVLFQLIEVRQTDIASNQPTLETELFETPLHIYATVLVYAPLELKRGFLFRTCQCVLGVGSISTLWRLLGVHKVSDEMGVMTAMLAGGCSTEENEEAPVLFTYNK